MTDDAELLEPNNKLVEQRREMNAMFATVPDSIAILDSETRVTFANQNLRDLLETDEASLLGRPIAELLGGKTMQDLTGQVNDAGQTRSKATFVNANGRTVFVEISISAITTIYGDQYVLIVRDKSHERDLAQAMLVSEQLKSNIIDSSLDALITINGRGEIIDFSQSAEFLFGWRKSEIVGQTMVDRIVPEELRAAHEKGMAHFLATGVGHLIGKRIETTARRRTGSCFPVELTLTAIWIDGDAFITATIRDITERIEREKELIASKIKAQEASVAKSRFLSYMSHEIRSPMNAVLGALALIHEEGKLEDSQQRYLDLARQSGDSLLGVINEILDLSKIESGHIEYERVSFSPGELIKSATQTVLGWSAKSSFELTVHLCQSLPPVIVADRIHIKQVLIILLDNAKKFTSLGEVKITASAVSCAAAESGRMLRIEVSDTGPGIPANLLETIFLEFEQVDAARDSGIGGTGLGLAIAKRLINGMDGIIWAESDVGFGSTFVFEVPFFDIQESAEEKPIAAVDNILVESEADQEADKPTVLTGKSILLVDDVDANLMIGSRLLMSRGYRVDVACDGLQAVELASKNDYSLILMDIRMPTMNGLEAAERIRQSGGINSRTPILALTANAETSEIKRCTDAGMDGFVSKPFNIDSLDSTIMRCLSERDHKDSEKGAPRGPDNNKLEVMSMSVLDQLIKDTSLESLPMMISVFVNEIKKRIEGINLAIELNDEAEIREQAHALKSCSGTFGGLRLQAAASELEYLASKSLACSCPELLMEVKKVADETLAAYAEHRESLG